jgi:hypothetical protein
MGFESGRSRHGAGHSWLLRVVVLAAFGGVAACSATEGDLDFQTTGSGGGNGGNGNEGGISAGGTGGTVIPPECVVDTDCPGEGEVCKDNECVTGCSVDKPCQVGFDCCDGGCLDILNDLDHCGSCTNECDTPANMPASCVSGMCQLGSCDPGFFDCDGQSSTGCESPTPCSCTPNATQPCYPAAPSTQGVGPCIAGWQQCNDAGTAWSLCFDWVGPSPETCGNMIDEDCSGMPDDPPDVDGDTWNACEGDCCETLVDCSDPQLVNPGAFEVVGNMVDDDCDVASSDITAPPPCSANQAIFSNVTALAMAQAMDVCQNTTANPPKPQKKWGLIAADYKLSNGQNPSGAQLNNMQSWQAAVLQNYGTAVFSQQGPTMAGISTGRMRDNNDPGFVTPNGGTAFNSSSTPPPAYWSAHGNALPASLGCSGNCTSGNNANDSINLALQIRVPTNAQSLSYKFKFYSAEFPEWTCTTYNDFYLAIMTSGAPMIPADHNISFDSVGNPFSVNNGFFDVCSPSGCYNCPAGTAELAGTGMQAGVGGGSVWLVTTAPVLPGETITLELMVFDVGDWSWDSLSLLDDFEWSVNASGVGTGPAG